MSLDRAYAIRNDDRMPTADNVRGVLQALWESHPQSGPGLISGLDIRHGWADAIVVTLYPRDAYAAHDVALGEMKTGVELSLGDVRHVVSVAQTPRLQEF